MSCLVRRGFIRPFGSVLGLAGMEWTFFIAAHKVLCFGWGARAGMMPHQGFGCCQTVLAQHQGSVSHSALLSLCTFREQAGGGRGVWRGHSLNTRPKLTEGYSIPDDVTLYKESSGKRVRKRGVLLSQCMCWSSTFQEVEKHLLASGKHWINSLFTCACSFCFPC